MKKAALDILGHACWQSICTHLAGAAGSRVDICWAFVDSAEQLCRAAEPIYTPTSVLTSNLCLVPVKGGRQDQKRQSPRPSGKLWQRLLRREAARRKGGGGNGA